VNKTRQWFTLTNDILPLMFTLKTAEDTNVEVQPSKTADVESDTNKDKNSWPFTAKVSQNGDIRWCCCPYFVVDNSITSSAW
jgi:hypothetical protein